MIAWAVDRRVGTLAVGDPRGVLNLDAGRRHNQRTRDWRIGHLIAALKDKAEAAGISLILVDERGTSSTCPACRPGSPNLPGGCWSARLASSPATATCPRPPNRPTRRRHHAGHPGLRHAPPRRGAPARCRPLAT